MANFVIPFTDYGGESSSVNLPVDDAVLDADLTGLFNAIDGVAVGNAGQSRLNIHTAKDAGPGGNSADPFATRKLKYLCRYHDAVTLEKHELELPCPDMDLLTGNTDFAGLAAGAGLTFKTEFDTSVKAPKSENAVVLDSVELRGRDLRNRN